MEIECKDCSILPDPLVSAIILASVFIVIGIIVFIVRKRNEKTSK